MAVDAIPLEVRAGEGMVVQGEARLGKFTRKHLRNVVLLLARPVLVVGYWREEGVA